MSNTTSTRIDVYDGLQFLGHVVDRHKGRRCEAFSAAGSALGVFPSPRKAARAVYEAAREQRHGVAA